ncbi:hypothetical protein ACPXCO_23560 [Streptomyces cyaneofuscatus]|uniref:hypothetical protein n=1 Tax=Streptomyces cyaneofuscatus TaxID=66883 RepID=UPI003CF1DD43
MPLDHPAAFPPPVSDAWEMLNDGLLIQRIYLHQQDIRTSSVLSPGECLLPKGASPAALLARPLPAPEATLPLVQAVGLRAWVTIPQHLGHADTAPASPLAQVTADTAATTTGSRSDDVLAQAVRAVCAAAAWWTGAFAAIRYTGGHHRSLEDVTAPLSLDALTETTRLVALGSATRVLRRHLQQTGDAGEEARTAFCRAVTEVIVAEPDIPGLAEELGELRLVDLLINALPWRGRHTAYRSGLGSGQVE